MHCCWAQTVANRVPHRYWLTCPGKKAYHGDTRSCTVTAYIIQHLLEFLQKVKTLKTNEEKVVSLR